jgi:hypothetical protein
MASFGRQMEFTAGKKTKTDDLHRSPISKDNMIADMLAFGSDFATGDCATQPIHEKSLQRAAMT